MKIPVYLKIGIFTTWYFNSKTEKELRQVTNIQKFTIAIIEICILCLYLCDSWGQVSPNELVTINTWPYSIELRDTASIQKTFLDYVYLTDKPNDSDSCLRLMEYIAQRSTELNFQYGIVRSNVAASTVLMFSGRYYDAIRKAEATLPLSRKGTETHKLIPDLYYIIGTSYLLLGNKPLAVENLLAAIRLADSKSYSTGTTVAAYVNFTEVISDKSAAIQYLDKAYQIAKSNDDIRAMVIALLNQSVLYERLGQATEAAGAIKKALIISNTKNSPYLQYNIHVRKCYNDLYRKDIKSAYESLQILSELVHTPDLSIATRNIYYMLAGNVYFQREEYPKAKAILLEGLQFAHKHQLYEQKSEIYKMLYRVSAKLQQPDEALLFLEKHTMLKDSLTNEKIAQNVNALEAQYRLHEKDKLLMEQQKSVEKRNYWIAGIASILVIAVIVFIAFTRVAVQKRKTKEKEREINTLKAVMKGEEAERSRIADALHDGVMVSFSTVKVNLDTLQIHMPESNLKETLHKTVKQFDDATAELRRSAHQLMPELLLKEGLVGALQYFCAKLKEGIEVTLIAQGDIPEFAQEYQLMFYRIVQELVQNAFKYSGCNHILVQLDALGDYFSLTVEDNGKGFDTSLLDNTNRHEHWGLTKIRSRIVSLNGDFQISSVADKGTSVYIEISTKGLLKQSG